MNQKEIKELIEFLKEQDIAEFELERGDVKVRIKRNVPGSAPTYIAAVPAPAHLPVQSAAGAPAAEVPQKVEAPAVVEEKLYIVKSPIVGTFYESPSPGAPPFVKAGDVVEVGQLLCIVEAMKLMNEIESDIAGEIVKKFINNGQPIEYGQELFTIRPRT
ncbi:MAG TPA: acetyl-CoA carboxylase biotin carboxyl carrier protein [Terriglobales bacterium]|jgi:acetyl-CoA carboxylase biotin carboxyl carrier protein